MENNSSSLQGCSIQLRTVVSCMVFVCVCVCVCVLTAQWWMWKRQGQWVHLLLLMNIFFCQLGVSFSWPESGIYCWCSWCPCACVGIKTLAPMIKVLRVFFHPNCGWFWTKSSRTSGFAQPTRGQNKATPCPQKIKPRKKPGETHEIAAEQVSQFYHTVIAKPLVCDLIVVGLSSPTAKKDSCFTVQLFSTKGLEMSSDFTGTNSSVGERLHLFRHNRGISMEDDM